MLESDAIIKYLYDTYGDGKVQKHSQSCSLDTHLALDQISLVAHVYTLTPLTTTHEEALPSLIL
jgi:hypothetical protein